MTMQTDIKPVIPVFETKEYRSDIDGLRAIAVLAVVFFHVFPDVIRGGFAGVDVFFVISGFLITKIIAADMRNGHFSYFKFYSRRIRRIFPSLFTILLFCFLMAVLAVFFAGKFLPLTNEFKQLMNHIAGGAGFISNFVLWRESGYFDTGSETKILLHLWSLGIEEQFYILWPVVLFATWKIVKRFGHAICFLFLLSLTYNFFVSQADPVADFYNPITRFWELMIGAFLATFKATPPALCSPFSRNTLSIVGLAALVVSITAFDKTLPFPGFYGLLPTFGAAFLILAGKDSVINRRLLSNPVLVLVGLVSYPLYLWHWPLLALANIVTLGHATPATRTSLAVLSFLLAWLTYAYVEKPIRFGGHNRVKVMGLCVGMAILAGMCLAGAHLQGIGARFLKFGTWLPVTEFSAERDWREHDCLLLTEDFADGFGPDCAENTGKPLLFLWGDSHAAALYPGFRQVQPTLAMDIAQYTSSACPPYVNPVEANSKCALVTQKILAALIKASPNTVVLHGRWAKDYDFRKLKETVDFLREHHVANVLLVGPVPEWENSLPQSLLFHTLNAGSFPERMKTGLVAQAGARDNEMALAAKTIGIGYLSAYHAFCNSDGCLTRLDDPASTLTALDYGHLTPQASRFFIEKSMDAIQASFFTTPSLP